MVIILLDYRVLALLCSLSVPLVAVDFFLQVLA